MLIKDDVREITIQKPTDHSCQVHRPTIICNSAVEALAMVMLVKCNCRFRMAFDTSLPIVSSCVAPIRSTYPVVRSGVQDHEISSIFILSCRLSRPCRCGLASTGRIHIKVGIGINVSRRTILGSRGSLAPPRSLLFCPCLWLLLQSLPIFLLFKAVLSQILSTTIPLLLLSILKFGRTSDVLSCRMA